MKLLNYRCPFCGGEQITVVAYGTVPGWILSGEIINNSILGVNPGSMVIEDYDDNCYNVYKCSKCDDPIYKGYDDGFIALMKERGFIKEAEGDENNEAKMEVSGVRE